MRNHSFPTLTVAISQKCCIDNQNIHNTKNHMCLSCMHDDVYAWWYAELLAKLKIK